MVICLTAPGARGQWLFDNLSTRDGVSNREIRCLMRDLEGFVWLGTANGINRFDGSQVKTWNKSHPEYPAELGETIYCFIEYGKNRIWIGTNAGVGIFNKTTNLFEMAVFTTIDTSTKRVSINKFVIDHQDRLWVSTQKGTFVWEKKEFVPVSKIFPFAKDLDKVSCYQAGFLFDSLRHTIWAATGTELYAVDIDKKQIYSSANNPAQFPFFKKQVVVSVSFDATGNIWWGERDALCHYNFTTKKAERITSINNNPAWRLGGGPNALFFDRKGRLWISTWMYAVFVRHPDGTFEKLLYDDKVPYSIGYEFFWEAIQDEQGKIWLATVNGLSQYSEDRFVTNIVKVPSYSFYLPSGFANIYTLMPGQKGMLWIGKMEGLVGYDSSKREYTLYKPYPGLTQWNEIHDIDTINGKIWCGTGNGVYILDPGTKKLNRFPYLPENKDTSVIRPVLWIRRDKQGWVWIGIWNDAVYRFDPQSEKLIRFDGKDPAFADLSTSNSSSAFETSDGEIWINSYLQGIRIYNLETGRFRIPPDQGLQNSVFYSMAESRDGYIWASSNRGCILKCTKQGTIVDSITTRDGLGGNPCRDFCFDDAGRLWATSREGLFCVEPESGRLVPVNINVTYSFNDHWNHLMRVGDKFYGTMLDHIVVVDPKKFQRLPALKPPLISGFKVFQKDHAFSSETPTRLSHRQNFFSIDFSSPFHRDYSSIQYAYKLEGFDKDWVYCGRKQTAEYTNVPAGNYTFHVKSTDGSDKWMSSASLLSISIKPQFTKTIWFYLLIGALTIVTARMLWLRRKRMKRNKQVEKTIDYFANSVYGENSVNEICWDIARNCISQLQFEDCVVYLLDKDRNILVQKAAYGPKNPKGHEIENPLEIGLGKGIVGTVAATGKPLLINDTTLDSRYIVDDEPRMSELAVPILHNNEVIGVIDSENPKKNFFQPEHQKAMVTIASISANKIAEAQAESLSKENEIKLLEINKMLAESQLMALRAQMNPHFVFNCLNSIQECIVTQKYGEASNYLNKFSKLFRMVLNNSGKNLVTISEEKDVLQLYLELELMRFEKSFDHTIYIDEKLETEEILIPSMLLQPYVENALWHGLMHKTGVRTLSIRFEKLSDDIFRCTIDDNGIGRKRSFELKEQQSKTKRHESKGLKISEDRIEVLRKQGYHALLEIKDKYDISGQASGTTVIIELSTFLTS